MCAPSEHVCFPPCHHRSPIFSRPLAQGLTPLMLAGNAGHAAVAQKLQTALLKHALNILCEHSATHNRLLHGLAQLATYQMEVTAFEQSVCRSVCDAVEARRATLEVGFAPLEVRYPLLTQKIEADEQLLRRLAREAQAAGERVKTAERAMPPCDELPRLSEDAWHEHAFARDQARQELVHIAELRLEGLSAKQQCIERALSNEYEGAIELSELPIAGNGPCIGLPNANGGRARPILAVCADTMQSVRELAEEHRSRRRRLQGDLQACTVELRAARKEAEVYVALHRRRMRAEALLEELEEITAKVKVESNDEVDARHALEKLRSATAPGDPAVERAHAKHQSVNDRLAALLRQRDDVVSRIAALSASPGAGHGQVFGDDASIPLDFPELPVRTQRIVQPHTTYKLLDAAGRARFDIEMLLRNAGLLVYDRSYESYNHLVVIPGKPNVKRATLRGVPTILKEYGMDEFKRVKRAITAASRLRHPGIVPVECAFLHPRIDVVIVQSPYYSGGNMRQWCKGKADEVKLRAAQKVAEAVRFLHTHGVLHRDLKPENIVFSGDGPDATPALCDFDLSVYTSETMLSTSRRGTLLYLAPEPSPSTASDVFALGVTLFDILLCDGDEETLCQTLAPSIRELLGVDLERVRGELARRTINAGLVALISSMLAPQPAERPLAAAVAEKLSELVNARTCYVCHDQKPRGKGIECDAPEHHFTCDGCFSDHISRFEALCEVDGVQAKCCASDIGCTARFSPLAAMQHAMPLAVDRMFRHIKDRMRVSMQN